MSNTFVTPKAVTTIAQSRINYNDSMLAVLDNFASTGSPGPSNISVEGIPGLRTGMLWYKSGTNKVDGQGRLFVYNGSEFTRDGVNAYKVSSVSEANSAVVAGAISYGELVLVGSDTLYIVNTANTGVVPLSVGTATNSALLDGLDSSQFLRSDEADTMSGKLTVTSNLSISGNVGIGVSNPTSTLDIAKDTIVFSFNDTNGSLAGAMDAYIDFKAAGQKHGELGFNTSNGTLGVKNLQGNVVIAADTNDLHTDSRIQFDIDSTTKAVLTSTGKFGVNTSTPVDEFEVVGSANVTSTLKVGSQTTLASVEVQDLTQHRVVYVGASGELVDSSSLLFANSNLSITGNVFVSGDVTTASDIRLKSNVKPIENALSTVKQLRGVSFTKQDSKNNIGLIAQEVEKILPDLVGTDGEFKSVAYQNIVALLIEAIKEQQIQIERLQSER
jgi:hypothetical protein